MVRPAPWPPSVQRPRTKLFRLRMVSGMRLRVGLGDGGLPAVSGDHQSSSAVRSVPPAVAGGSSIKQRSEVSTTCGSGWVVGHIHSWADLPLAKTISLHTRLPCLRRHPLELTMWNDT